MRRQVGMKSEEQVALEEGRIAFRTSSEVAGVKEDKGGGQFIGGQYINHKY